MEETRFATYQDLESIKEFLKENPFDIRKEITASLEEKFERVENILKFPDTDKTHQKIVINLIDGKIDGMVCMMMFKFINAYKLFGLKISKKAHYYNPKKNSVENLLCYLGTYAESLGYYSCYTIADALTGLKRHRINLKHLWFLERYDLYTIGYIDQDETSYFPLFNINMNNKKSKLKYTVFNFVLREEFRSNINLSIAPNFK